VPALRDCVCEIPGAPGRAPADGPRIAGRVLDPLSPSIPLNVLGGSLFQFALPLALAGAFLRQRDPFGAVVCTWWAGQNLLDLAPYIADARALQIVLLGGKTGAEVEGHDWEYLLTELGLLRFDRALGVGARRAGLMLMTAALVWGAVYLARTRPAAAVLTSRTE
jgi:hypothetical protein